MTLQAEIYLSVWDGRKIDTTFYADHETFHAALEEARKQIIADGDRTFTYTHGKVAVHQQPAEPPATPSALIDKEALSRACMSVVELFRNERWYKNVGQGADRIYLYCRPGTEERVRALGLTEFEGFPVLIREMGEILAGWGGHGRSA